MFMQYWTWNYRTLFSALSVPQWKSSNPYDLENIDQSLSALSETNLVDLLLYGNGKKKNNVKLMSTTKFLKYSQGFAGQLLKIWIVSGTPWYPLSIPLSLPLLKIFHRLDYRSF